MDLSGLLSTGLAAGILIPVLCAAVTLLILYMIIRAGVARGMRDHQLWLEGRALAQRERERSLLR